MVSQNQGQALPTKGGIISDWQVEHRDDGRLLLGLAIQSAVLDIESDRQTLRACLDLLESPLRGLRDIAMGRFGAFVVTLNYGRDDSVSIFVDGPDFTLRRGQSAAIWVDKASLHAALRAIVDG